MSLTAHNLNSLLGELNDALLLEGAAPVTWVVCGGTALALQGLSARTTEDVDVLGSWNDARDGSGVEIIAIGTFAPEVLRAIARVALAHPELAGLRSRWVNLGAQEIVKHGLPAGALSRLVPMRIGERLTLQLLGRVDLIALKLYAASDDLGRRQQIHLDDVRVLDSTAAELDDAIQWVLRMPDPQHRLRPSLKSILEELGHEDLSYYI